jgi:cephalosporin hydroxylase
VGERGVIDLTADVYRTDQCRTDVVANQAAHADTIAAFHKLWYQAKHTWAYTFFEHVPLLKNPLDLWVYQEVIFDLKPTLIIETGTAYGGSALYFARQLDRLGQGSVISIDLDPAETLPQHKRITYVKGSSVDQDIVEAVARCAQTHPRVMVVLDSDHSAAHVFQELDAYAQLVTTGQFLVVEDTNITGHPVPVSWKGGPGPHEAVEEFLAIHPEFARDVLAERYLLTMHPGGWLRRQG